jgi:hypothetical protein
MLGFRTRAFSSYSLLTCFILITILPNPVFAQQGGVELPVEFFFGRWAEGTTVRGTGVFDEMYRPHWAIGGGYANDRLRFGGDFDFLPSTRNVDRSSIIGYAAFRPGARYLFALDKLSYVEHEFAIPQGFSDRDMQTSMHASGSHYNTDSVHLSDTWSQYQYSGGTALGEGEMQVHSAFDYRRDKEDEDDPAVSRPHRLENTVVRRTTSAGVFCMDSHAPLYWEPI